LIIVCASCHVNSRQGQEPYPLWHLVLQYQHLVQVACPHTHFLALYSIMQCCLALSISNINVGHGKKSHESTSVSMNDCIHEWSSSFVVEHICRIHTMMTMQQNGPRFVVIDPFPLQYVVWCFHSHLESSQPLC